MTKIIMMLFGALLAVSCTSPAVSKAVGIGADGATPIVVRTSESAVVVENHAGRPLLNVRITLTAPDAAKSFILVVPTLEIGATSEQPLTGSGAKTGRCSIRPPSIRLRWRLPPETRWPRATR